MRVAKIVAGFGLLAAGVVMLALPGPGWLAIAIGLGLLGDEFHWARRLLDGLKKTATRFSRSRRRRNADGAQEGIKSNRSSNH